MLLRHKVQEQFDLLGIAAGVGDENIRHGEIGAQIYGWSPGFRPKLNNTV